MSERFIIDIAISSAFAAIGFFGALTMLGFVLRACGGT